MRKGDKGKKVFGVILILAIIVSAFSGVVSAEEVVVYDKKVKVDSRQESTSIEDLTYMATEPATDSTSDVAYGAINPDYRISDSPYLRLPADMKDWPSIAPPEPHEVKGAENPTAVEIYNVATGEVIRLPITSITQQPVLKSTPPYHGLLPPGVVPKGPPYN